MPTIGERLDKLEVDMYKGDGKENPSITNRMALVEERLDKIAQLLGTMTKVVVGVIVIVLGQIVLRFMKLL